MANKKIIEIAFVGHSFCGTNLGVGALAFGELYAIEEACKKSGCDYHITCYEAEVKNPYINNPKVTLKEFNLKNILTNAHMFSKQDYIFDIGGGDSFSDIYGIKLYIIQIFIKLAILLSGKPYILPPQTYGPYNHWWARMFANFYIRHANLAYARDLISVNCLDKSAQTKVKTAADLGLSMTYTPLPHESEYTVGFNVSGLLYQSSELLGDVPYRDICKSIIERLLLRGYKVVLVPHVVIPDSQSIDNDYHVCVELAREYNLEQVPAFKSPKEAKAFISHCNFFIGSRMHATIAAVSSCVPTLPLAYSRKFKGVFEAIGYPYTIDLSTTSKGEILSMLDDMICNKQEEILNAIKYAKNKISALTDSYTTALSKLFK